ncbi:hypothetical protein BC351_14520 [Paenibacillus ferrarius]|uniref:Uncharacterized protein n=1 Tax=Paenibacillus ferrarius TaxID=1469647 RepID=A0A1V4H653_9BACL|nr:hypothetical protein [Paenibacillus ferrarius]OPH46696.1 hypothetical protein BC351_14520 [Paenibacillus ferrarius]
MNKQEALDDFLESFVFDQWLKDLLPIDQALEAQRSSIEQSFSDAFESVWTQVSELQEQGLKGDIRYVYISLMRTSIMENRPDYRIDAYDHNWFMDAAACVGGWRADFIFDPLFRRMEELEKQKSAYARKVTSMDIARIKQIEAVKYHLLAIEFMKTRISALLTSNGYLRMGKTPDIHWMVGEFRDQSELLVSGNTPVDDGNDGAKAQ